MMKNRLTTIGWTVIFIVIFLFSLNYWAWGEPVRLTFLNLPTWLFYFVGLQLIFAAAILIFSKYYWKDKTK